MGLAPELVIMPLCLCLHTTLRNVKWADGGAGDNYCNNQVQVKLTVLTGSRSNTFSKYLFYQK